MTDNITDRIERIIKNHQWQEFPLDECSCGVEWWIGSDGVFDSTDKSTCFDNHLAAAIVAKLGLRKVELNDPHGKPVGQHRYVTEWTADE